MTRQIDLVYPLYLDVPMMTSFLAALEDGVAYGTDITRRLERQKSTGTEGGGGIGIPSVGILSTLLNFDLRGKITGNSTTGSNEEIKLVKRHTEASLFMQLRNMLQERAVITAIDDMGKVESLKHAALIEVTGQISRSPLNEVLEAFFRILNIAGPEISDSESAGASLHAKKKRQLQ